MTTAREMEQKLIDAFRRAGIKTSAANGEHYIGLIQTKTEQFRDNELGVRSRVFIPGPSHHPMTTMLQISTLAKELADT